MFQQKMQEEEENRFCIYRNKTFNRRKIMIIFVAVLLLMVQNTMGSGRRISMKEKGISRRQEEIFMTEMVWF